MPELPEVQTVINELKTKIIGEKITKIDIRLPKLIKNVSIENFTQNLMGAKFSAIERIGKYIIFHFDTGYTLISHLRMEGKYFLNQDASKENDKNIHLVFKLTDYDLCYVDSRQFGTFHLYKTSDFTEAKEIKKIGIDPLNEKFSWEICKQLLIASNRAIKTLLLDQTLISGIGNIYADEILFAAGIYPLRKTKTLTDSDFKNIADHARRILKLAIEYKGTTIFSFQFAQGHTGNFQKMLQVHMRENQKCYRCGTLIKKIKVNGRGTYFCPYCQK